MVAASPNRKWSVFLYFCFPWSGRRLPSPSLFASSCREHCEMLSLRTAERYQSQGRWFREAKRLQIETEWLQIEAKSSTSYDTGISKARWKCYIGNWSVDHQEFINVDGYLEEFACSFFPWLPWQVFLKPFVFDGSVVSQHDDGEYSSEHELFGRFGIWKGLSVSCGTPCQLCRRRRPLLNPGSKRCNLQQGKQQAPKLFQIDPSSCGWHWIGPVLLVGSLEQTNGQCSG